MNTLTQEEIQKLANNPEFLKSLFATKTDVITAVRKELSAEEQAEQDRLRKLRQVLPKEIGIKFLELIQSDSRIRTVTGKPNGFVVNDIYVSIRKDQITVIVGSKGTTLNQKRIQKQREKAAKNAEQTEKPSTTSA